MEKVVKKRKIRTKIENLPLSPMKESLIEGVSKSLARKIDEEEFNKKYATSITVLKIVGAGLFLTASLFAPNLPRLLKPFLKNENAYTLWKRFNIPYLKRTLRRLEKQRLIEIGEENGMQVVKITDSGRRRILKYAIDDLSVEKPGSWDGKWRLISYDVPENLKVLRNVFREYLKAWGSYPLHESAFLHAYPCEKQVEFLREYLGIGSYIRIFHVSKIENDKPFREFFGV